VPQPCGCGGPRDDLELAHAQLGPRCVILVLGAACGFDALWAASLTSDLASAAHSVFRTRIRIQKILVAKNFASGFRGSGFGVLRPREDGPEPVATRTFGPRRSAVPSTPTSHPGQSARTHYRKWGGVVSRDLFGHLVIVGVVVARVEIGRDRGRSRKLRALCPRLPTLCNCWQ
jgi:hypothetical protein